MKPSCNPDGTLDEQKWQRFGKDTLVKLTGFVSD
jgi:hypothetical protein